MICKILGHNYKTISEYEVDREEITDGIISTYYNLERCRRCGQENKKVIDIRYSGSIIFKY